MHSDSFLLKYHLMLILLIFDAVLFCDSVCDDAFMRHELRVIQCKRRGSEVRLLQKRVNAFFGCEKVFCLS